MNSMQELVSFYNLNPKEFHNELNNICENGDLVIWGSCIDGLGSQYSDIDIYLFKNIKKKTIEHKQINNISMDIESIPISYAESLINKLNKNKSLSLSEIKILYRIKFGITVNSNSLLSISNFKEKIQYENLIGMLNNTLSTSLLSDYDDALKLYLNKEYATALFTAFSSLQNSIGLYASINGFPQVKKKWFYKQFQRASKENRSTFLKEYWKIIDNMKHESIDLSVSQILQLALKIYNETLDCKICERRC